ncbi:aldehyde dehydrogenase [Paraphoma chrysanthemicola]|nr:aldehyde dehydrogenase [Paraphoma chrysanthemicola]
MQNSGIPTKLFIANEYVSSEGHDRLALRNPWNDSDITNDVHVAGKDDINNACLAADAALKKGPWAQFTGAQRSAHLLRVAALMEENAEKLAYLESIPTGRPISAIIHFDIKHMVEVFRYYAGWADKIEGRSYIEDNGFYKIVRYEPIGICAGIASWNATFMYVGWKIAPALAAGNCFIFKSSEKSPLGALALGQLFKEAGFPPGVVQFVTGDGNTGSLLASHQKISKLSFTGSANIGRKIQEAAARSNLKKITLELGGKSPAIVFADAPMEIAIGGVGGGFLANSGQICVAASRVLVEESISKEFCSSLVKLFESVSAEMGANPLDASTTHGPVVDQQQFQRVMGYIEQGRRSAELLTGGSRIGTKGQFIQPTIFLNPQKDSSIWKEEIFGPVLTVVTFKDEEEAIELANETDYGLASCIYTSDVTRALRVSSRVQSGGVAINSPFLPELNTPFGGIKQSGYGHELGKDSLMSYMNAKSIHINMAIPKL